MWMIRVGLLEFENGGGATAKSGISQDAYRKAEMRRRFTAEGRDNGEEGG
jgi:hypothetical protein